MTAFPEAAPETTPDPFTVATNVFPLDQTPPGVASANGVVSPGQTNSVPVIGATDGIGLTVKLLGTAAALVVVPDGTVKLIGPVVAAAGKAAVIWVLFTTTTVGDAVPLKETEAGLAKPVPVMVIVGVCPAQALVCANEVSVGPLV